MADYVIDEIRKVLEYKKRIDLSELLKYSASEIIQSTSYGSKLYSTLSTLEIYSPSKNTFDLNALNQNDKDLIFEVVMQVMPPKDHSPEIYEIQYLPDRSLEPDRKSCFVIMPFRDPDKSDSSEDKWNKIFEFIKRCVENASDMKYKVFRSEAKTGSITADILRNLAKSDLVLADCTNKNGNVFYELGIRHSRRVGTILIAQKRSDFPFDLKDDASHIYDPDTNDGEKDFTDKLRNLIKYVENNADKADSLVGELLGYPELPKRDLMHILFNDEPHEITSDRPGSAKEVSSLFLQSSMGSFSSWVFLPSFNAGFRNNNLNTYIIAHDACSGKTMEIAGGKRVYLNVFSFSCSQGRTWGIWLADENGEYRSWHANDNGSIKKGWHHFLIRWNHADEIFEVLLDGENFIRCSNYKRFWPKAYSKTAFIGTWQNRAAEHFINTYFGRTIVCPLFLGEDFLKTELTLKPRFSMNTSDTAKKK